jgi:hypothetical protein
MAPTSDRNRAREGLYREALTMPKGLIDSYRQDLSIKPLGMVSVFYKAINEDELYPIWVPLLMLLFFSRRCAD